MEKEQLINEYISRCDKAIQNAYSSTTKLTNVELSIQGMSSTKNRIFLNELLAQDSNNVNYLEIGTWLGSTFVAALYGNTLKSAIAIDNFSQFSGTMTGFMTNCAKSQLQNFRFINSDCFNLSEADMATIKDVNVYFYDGDHTHEDQRKALTYYINVLQDVFIFIVDDWNHEPARTGTRAGLLETNLKVHKEWELPANYNGDQANWWNGLYVAVCEKTP
jgi:hypothetical protein